jgi:prophage tail gpP-like protein
MPNMNRLTWSGIALHAGNLPGYPASHGCVRLPMGFSEMLFGITRKGITVVLADNTSQPSSVVHPKLILGDDARNKFQAVDTHVNSLANDYDRNQNLKHASIVISHKDSKATLYEDGVVVAHSKVTIADHKRPLSEAVYQLNRTNAKKEEMYWSQIDYGNQSTSGLKTDLPRIQTPDDFRAMANQRAHRGMTLVTTDQHDYKRNHASDFTIIDGLY